MRHKKSIEIRHRPRVENVESRGETPRQEFPQADLEIRKEHSKAIEEDDHGDARNEIERVNAAIREVVSEMEMLRSHNDAGQSTDVAEVVAVLGKKFAGLKEKRDGLLRDTFDAEEAQQLIAIYDKHVAPVFDTTAEAVQESPELSTDENLEGKERKEEASVTAREIFGTVDELKEKYNTLRQEAADMYRNTSKEVREQITPYEEGVYHGELAEFIEMIAKMPDEELDTFVSNGPFAANSEVIEKINKLFRVYNAFIDAEQSIKGAAHDYVRRVGELHLTMQQEIAAIEQQSSLGAKLVNWGIDPFIGGMTKRILRDAGRDSDPSSVHLFHDPNEPMPAASRQFYGRTSEPVRRLSAVFKQYTRPFVGKKVA